MDRWYGIDVRDRMVRQALFVCPRCGLNRDGTEYEPRRWVTVLGLHAVRWALCIAALQIAIARQSP